MKASPEETEAFVNNKSFHSKYSGMSLTLNWSELAKIISFKLYDKKKEYQQDSYFSLLGFEITYYGHLLKYPLPFTPLELFSKMIKDTKQFNDRVRKRKLVSETKRMLSNMKK